MAEESDAIAVEPRTAYNDALPLLIEKADQQPTIMIVIDVDHFKRVNDSHGHAVGDAVLQKVMNVLGRLTSRWRLGRVFRYGGDEFVIWLNDVTAAEAIPFIERIRDEIRAMPYEPLSKPITVSIGVASTPNSAGTLLFEHADRALREAKRTGRDGYQIFSSEAHLETPRERRLIVHPALFKTLDKTLRIAFLRTAQYYHAASLVAQRQELPLKSVSVLGQYDLLVIHLGDRQFRFEADLEPLRERRGDDTLRTAIRHFVVERILKFHGHIIEEDGEPRRPDKTTLKQLIELAEGKALPEVDTKTVRRWISERFALGFEGTELREGETEAYVTVDIFSGRDDDVARELFDIVIREDILPADHVVSFYEGHAAGTNLQFVIRTRSSNTELFDFVEYIHERCHHLRLHQILTSTYMVVRHKALRVYRSLLIPPLNEGEKHVRDVVIMPELSPEQQTEFLYGRPDLQPAIIEQVRRINDAFGALGIPTAHMSSSRIAELRKRAIRGTVTGDIHDLKPVFLDLVGAVEAALRRKVVEIIHDRFGGNLETARDARVISNSAYNKKLEGLTLGEVRETLKGLQRIDALDPSVAPPAEVLDGLQKVNDLRNRLAHGDEATVDPVRATQQLGDLVELIRDNAGAIFAKNPVNES